MKMWFTGKFKRITALIAALLIIIPLFTANGFISYASIMGTKPGNPAVKTKAISTTKGNYYVYILNVATGINAGENVDFFKISYKLANGSMRTEYIFPKVDGESRTKSWLDIAAKEGTNIKGVVDLSDFKSALPGASTPGYLNSYNNDDIIFGTKDEIAEIVDVNVYCVDQGTWSCKGLNIYSVDELYNNKIYNGTMSSDGLLCFKGRLIAECSVVNSVLTWDHSGFVKMNDGFKTKLTIHNPGVDFASFGEGMNVGVSIQLADVEGAGLEQLVNKFNEKKSLKDLNYPEAIQMKVEYINSSGNTVTVEVPVLMLHLLFLYQQKSVTKNALLDGLVQQDGKLVFSMYLKGLVDINTVKISLKIVSDDNNNISSFTSDKTRNQDIKKSLRTNGTSIAMESIVLYNLDKEGVSMSAAVGTGDNDAQVEYTFSGNPDRYWLSERPEGAVISYGSNYYNIVFEEFTKYSRIRHPKGKKATALIKLVSDDTTMTGGTGALKIKLGYQDLGGVDKETPTFDVADVTRQYLGYWTCSEAGIDNFGYLYNKSGGRSLVIPVTVEDAAVYTSITITSADEMQFKGVEIYTVKNMGDRQIHWENASSLGKTSNRIITRTEPNTNQILNYTSTIYISANKSVRVDFTSDTIVVEEGKSIMDYYWEMTWEETHYDFGFTEAKKNYTINVQVGGEDDGSTSNGDAGSKNQFFFQLEFQKGFSAYVLANQQLSADGFRTGEKETFTVSTNADYGDLLSLHIIVNDIDESVDIADKLFIKQVDVVESDVNGLSNNYVFSNIGWLGTEYYDSSEAVSLAGRSGRAEEKLAHIYPVSEITTNLSFEVAFTTGTQSDFAGQLSAEISYYDSSNIPQTMKLNDIVRSMYEYAGFDGTKHFPSDSMGYALTSRALPNAEYMFRENHTDRFIIQIPDIKSFHAIKFSAASNVDCYWNPTSVYINAIKNQGNVIISKDEYVRRNTFLTDTPVAYSDTQDDSTAYRMQVKAQAGARTQVKDFIFNLVSSTIDVSKEKGTVTIPVSRLPESNNDMLNVYVFPGNERNQKNFEDYDLEMKLIFTNTIGKTFTTAPVNMSRTTYNDQPLFYTLGISAKYFSKLEEMKLVTDVTNTGAYIDYAVVQHVRSGVVVGNYFINHGLANDAAGGITMHYYGYSKPGAYKQVVMLQVSKNQQASVLKAEERDMAVAINYTSALSNIVGDVTLRSPYVYLTDQDIKKIESGGILVLNFNEDYVQDITGITMLGTGNLNVSITRACVGNFKADGDLTETYIGIDELDNDRISLASWSSFANGLEVGDTAKTMKLTTNNQYGSDYIQPVKLRFKTRNLSDGVDPSSYTNVRMELHYYDSRGIEQPVPYDDIRSYITGGETNFKAGTTENVVILMSGVDKFISAVIEPWDEDDSHTATWGLEQVEASLPLKKDSTVRRGVSVDYIKEGSEYTVSFERIQMTAPWIYSDTSGDYVSEVSGTADNYKTETLVMRSNKELVISPKITGTRDNAITVKCESIVGDTATEVKDACSIKYDENFEYDANNVDDEGNPIEPDKYVVFTSPVVKEAGGTKYRVTITSVADPTVSLVFVITVLPLEDITLETTYVTTAVTDGKEAIAEGTIRSGEHQSVSIYSGRKVTLGYVLEKSMTSSVEVLCEKFDDDAYQTVYGMTTVETADGGTGKVIFTSPDLTGKTESEIYRITISSSEDASKKTVLVVTVIPAVETAEPNYSVSFSATVVTDGAESYSEGTVNMAESMEMTIKSGKKIYFRNIMENLDSTNISITCEQMDGTTVAASANELLSKDNRDEDGTPVSYTVFTAPEFTGTEAQAYRLTFTPAASGTSPVVITVNVLPGEESGETEEPSEPQEPEPVQE